MLALRISSHGRSIEMPPRWTMPSTPRLIASEIGGNALITPADLWISALEKLAQPRADTTRRAGDKDGSHGYSVAW
jgi:hypothetical protein